jgi:hypothetical protein
MIGDWHWEGDRLISAGLVHGAPDDDGPMLQMHTTTRDPSQDVQSLRIAESALSLESLRRPDELSDPGKATTINAADIPCSEMSSGGGDVVCPGGVLVVEGAGLEAAVQDADESVC